MNAVVNMVLELILVVREIVTFSLTPKGWLVVVGGVGVLLFACMSFICISGFF